MPSLSALIALLFATPLVAGASLPQTVTRRQAATTFSTLTYNVAGLPAFLNNNGVQDKEASTLEVGRIFAANAYDVIHVQEDFNYHAYLYRTDNHTYRTATSGGVPFGSGLNTMSNFPFSNFTRTKWDECSNASEFDCLTPKGFSFMTVEVANGTFVDFYNLHADAGDEQGDTDARVSNIEQVAAAVQKTSSKNAVVVMGDTNTRHTRIGDKLATILASASLTDTWVELVKGGEAPAPGSAALVCSEPVPADNLCEVVDKVFYKSGETVKLTPTTWEYVADQFLTANGSALSDHTPIEVTFKLS